MSHKAPKRSTQQSLLTTSGLATPLPLGEGHMREVPTEFKVFPAGPFTTTKGIFNFTANSAASVMAEYAARRLPLMGDYEHQTDAESMGLPPMEAPASITEMVPEVRYDEQGRPELWVKNVQWTDKAAAYLRAGEYRLFSPVFSHTAEGEILSLVRIALTNKPAIDGLQPLVAATDTDDEDDDEEEEEMSTACTTCSAKEELIGQLKAQLSALTTDSETKLKALRDECEGLKSQCSALTAKLSAFETKDQAATATATALSELTGEKDPAKVLGILTGYKASHGELATLKADNAAKALAAKKSEYATLTDAAVKDGRLPPAKKTEIDELMKKHGIEAALAFLTTIVGTSAAPAAPIVTLATSAAAQPNPSADVITPELREVAERTGTPLAWIKK